ncbi:MAG: copper-binding protein [Gemmataceae bacterium]
MKVFQCFLVAGLVALSAVTAGCNSAGTESGKKAAENLYDVNGKVTALDREKPSVTLDHEDIPGLMKAMTMEFRVADAKALEGLQVGDAVRAKLRKDGAGYVVTQIAKR